jgi:hypothetical protein
MKLITELVEQVEYITEAKESGEKQHYIQGIFLQADRKNKNGRIYEMSVLEPEVNRYIADVVKHNRAYGELGHPEGPAINLDRVSHIITELKRDGSNFIGKAKLTNTPMGNIARGLLESGASLGVSSRALGSLHPDHKTGAMMVQPDLRLATAADIVADPSAPDAFVKGIMENVDWVYDSVKDTWREEKLELIKKEIHNMSKREIEEQKLAIFENYVSSLAFKINK